MLCLGCLFARAAVAYVTPACLPLSRPGELVDMWEPIKGPDAVQTPAEMYAMLAREGLAVKYLRVPVTDGKAPQPCDVDAIIAQVSTAACPHATSYQQP